LARISVKHFGTALRICVLTRSCTLWYSWDSPTCRLYCWMVSWITYCVAFAAYTGAIPGCMGAGNRILLLISRYSARRDCGKSLLCMTAVLAAKEMMAPYLVLMAVVDRPRS